MQLSNEVICRFLTAKELRCILELVSSWHRAGVFPCWPSTHDCAPPGRNDLQSGFDVSQGFDELSFYNAEIKRTVEPTTCKIWVGGSSLATVETSLTVVE